MTHSFLLPPFSPGKPFPQAGHLFSFPGRATSSILNRSWANQENVWSKDESTFENYSFFLSPRKTIKKQTGFCIKFSPTLKTSEKQVPPQSISKLNIPLSCCSLFFKECLDSHVRIKMVNEHCWLAP